MRSPRSAGDPKRTFRDPACSPLGWRCQPGAQSRTRGLLGMGVLGGAACDRAGAEAPWKLRQPDSLPSASCSRFNGMSDIRPIGADREQASPRGGKLYIRLQKNNQQRPRTPNEPQFSRTATVSPLDCMVATMPRVFLCP